MYVNQKLASLVHYEYHQRFKVNLHGPVFLQQVSVNEAVV